MDNPAHTFSARHFSGTARVIVVECRNQPDSSIFQRIKPVRERQAANGAAILLPIHHLHELFFSNFELSFPSEELPREGHIRAVRVVVSVSVVPSFFFVFVGHLVDVQRIARERAFYES